MVSTGMQEFHNLRQHGCINDYGWYDVTFQLNPNNIISDWRTEWKIKRNLKGFYNMNDFFFFLNVFFGVIILKYTGCFATRPTNVEGW